VCRVSIWESDILEAERLTVISAEPVLTDNPNNASVRRVVRILKIQRNHDSFCNPLPVNDLQITFSQVTMQHAKILPVSL
jgi:hypothetical protein